MSENHSQFIIYQTEDGETKLYVRFENETVWLTQKLMAELFSTTPENILMHLKNIYSENELAEEATTKDFLVGTKFRQWAIRLLDEYLVKGFTMDDERLKDPGKHFGVDYFDELLARVRDIRSSEKRFYQKIRDIYDLAVDYDPKADETKQFVKVVQNKLHWAISGLMAAEIIHQRADSQKDNMGLTSWQGDKVRKRDVGIAKNYLNDTELEQLNRLVTMYLDYAEMQAERRKALFMSDWREKLDAFLQFNEHEILKDAGKVKMAIAKQLAEEEYEKFNHQRLLDDAKAADEHDFEQLTKITESIEKPKDK